MQNMQESGEDISIEMPDPNISRTSSTIISHHPTLRYRKEKNTHPSKEANHRLNFSFFNKSKNTLMNLQELPNDIFYHIFSLLDNPNRLLLTNVCKKLFNYYALSFSNTYYGKLLQLNEAIKQEIQELKQHIDEYHRSQKISILNLAPANRIQKFVLISFCFGLISELYCLYVATYLYSEGAQNQLFSFNRLGLIIEPLFYFAYQWLWNKEKLNELLDHQAITKIESLFVNHHAFIKEAVIQGFNYQQLTHRQFNQFLQRLQNMLQNLSNTFDNHIQQFMGTQTEVLKLSDMEMNDMEKDYFKFFLNRWNKDNPEQEDSKYIAYRI